MAIRFTGLASGIDTESIISDLMKVERMRVERVEKKKTLVEWKKEAWEEMNSELYSFFKNELFDFKSSSTYNQKKITSSNTNVVTVKDNITALTGTHHINVTSVATASYLTGNELDDSINGSTVIASRNINLDVSLGDEEKRIRIVAGDDGELTISELVSQLNEDEDLVASYDVNTNRIFISTKDAIEGTLEIKSTGTASENALNIIGFDDENRIGTEGSFAKFTYNGTEFTSETNEVNINGLSMVITGTGDSTISVSQDTDAIYESIKSFVNKYNELQAKIITKIDAEYVSDDYQPLTDEEKEAMTEEEIELWENKIKDSILRRDDILTNLSYTMRSTLTTSVFDDLDYKNLSQLGIITGSYTENGKLHIEGDIDDDLYGLNENKLKKAIEENPEGVAEFFTKLGESLYNKLSEKMESTTLSSALTFYNDKYLDEQIRDYEDEIYELEDQLLEIEERYYAQFTAMEQAIQQANSTASWLSQQLGGL